MSRRTPPPLPRLSRGFLALLLCALILPVAAQTDYDFGGHTKYQFIYIDVPGNSIFEPYLGSGAADTNLEARLKFSARKSRWDFKLDYQFIASYSDTLQLARRFPDSAQRPSGIVSDQRRWWNLTYSSGGDGKTALIHRLDRVSIGYTTDHTVLRFGRQAISWGNGMIYTPMDIFNPFDPAAVDKEYKTGDDMLYGQYLFDNGNDLQAVAVIRRDPLTGDVESGQRSTALKYHGFQGQNEYDLLAAEHYGDLVLGAGGVASIGGAIWRGDLTWTRTDNDDVFSVATSLSYSWIWAGRNVSGLIEYYFNGFGQKNSAYSPDDLILNPDLLRRLERGELFTLARNYLAASATVEMNPLLLVTPNLFINLEDPSALAQLVVQYNWQQNLVILGSLNIPVGPDGSEYGGTESFIEDLYFSTGASIFIQLAWYF